MRLTPEQISSIITTLLEFSPTGSIYLHGSRLDENKKGGDIDLFFVVDDSNFKDLAKQKHIMIANLSLRLNEQKVDLILLSDSKASSYEFFQNSIKQKIN